MAHCASCINVKPLNRTVIPKKNVPDYYKIILSEMKKLFVFFYFNTFLKKRRVARIKNIGKKPIKKVIGDRNRIVGICKTDDNFICKEVKRLWNFYRFTQLPIY